MSIGTLLAYSLVAISVLILRYKKEDQTNFGAVDVIQSADYIESRTDIYEGSLFSRCLNLSRQTAPDSFSSRLSLILIALLCKCGCLCSCTL